MVRSAFAANQGRQNAFARAVYARLGVASLVAWGGAWAVAVPDPLRRAVLVSSGDVVGMTLLGAAIVAAPFLIWALARVAIRSPAQRLGAALLWSFAFVAGAGANILFQAATAQSLGSVFCILAVAFAALNGVTRLSGASASVVATFATLSLVGEGLAFLFDRVLTHWSHAGADVFAVMAAVIVTMFAAPRINRLWRRLHGETPWNALVDFAVMNVLSLTQTQSAFAAASAQTSAQPVVSAAPRKQAPTDDTHSIPTRQFEHQS